MAYNAYSQSKMLLIMKYSSFLPLSALFALGLIQILVGQDIMPSGTSMLENLQGFIGEYFYLMIFLIILLESIVYVGFYFPGQFFAVVLVIGSKPQLSDIVYLTIAMVAAATIGSACNYALGRRSAAQKSTNQAVSIKRLLIAMIHINSLAFFMFAQGQNRRPFKIVALAGLFNLPYYLLLIAGTAVLSEQIMGLAENTAFLFTAIGVWLCIALLIDVRAARRQNNQLPNTSE